MDRKVLGVIIGVAGIFLWFMPFVSWEEEFFGVTWQLYQTGYHIGGIAYLLLFSMFAYSVLSWFRLHPLRIIAGALSLLICLILFVQDPSYVAWGLMGLIMASIVGIVIDLIDNRKDKQS